MVTIIPVSPRGEADLKKTNDALAPFWGTRYGIRFRYGKDDASTAVPRFLKTIRTLKLVKETK
ncbi:hypothetical protein [Paenibacillus harenae]|uniref:hypothetical protein n=1 Tax=Paenibacillus harenae TaxID=306543 RepID=UPI002790E39B|nr:hypothetical protein [Paenibacillus harenae]MDQ0061400.1 hypothetical protein [Paenibacillus harenae]